MASSRVTAPDVGALAARLERIEARLAAIEERGRPRAEDGAAILELARTFGEAAFTALDALPVLRARHVETAGESGCWLRMMRGRTVAGLRLERHGRRWRLHMGDMNLQAGESETIGV